MNKKKELLIIFAKLPEPGKVKTRLGTGVGDDCACELYESFIKATVSCAALCDVEARIDITPETPTAARYFEEKYPGVKTAFQKEGDLGEKLVHSFDISFGSGYEKICVIGSDSPDLPSAFILDAFESLEKSKIVIGPSSDGGYYLVGLSAPAPAIFSNIPWSSKITLQKTLEACEAIGAAPTLLSNWNDVDDVYDIIQLRDRLKAEPSPPPHHKILLEEIMSALYAENPNPEEE